MLTASASDSGLNADWNTLKPTTIAPRAKAGTGRSKAIIVRPAPTAANWSARTRPKVMSARWPQTGHGQGEPEGRHGADESNGRGIQAALQQHHRHERRDRGLCGAEQEEQELGAAHDTGWYPSHLRSDHVPGPLPAVVRPGAGRRAGRRSTVGGGRVPPIVLALIAAAAVMHAAWNVVLKRSGDPLITSGRAMIAGTLAFAPFAAIAWLAEGRPAIPSDAVVLGVISGLIECIVP